MTLRRRGIPQRRRIFLGCEGESERSYGALLARLVEKRRRVHIDAVLLKPGGGDPLALIELAIRRVRERTLRNGAYTEMAVLLDADTRGISRERDSRAIDMADKEGLRLVWQEPCHEAFLLRHLQGCQMLRPMTSASAMDELRRRWPQYRKALPAMRLADRIDEDAVRRAAAVEGVLKDFLAEIDFGQD
jgi:hypothetical protein